MIKKILVLESSYLTKKPWGGSAKEAKFLIQALVKNGYDAFIIKNTSFFKILFSPPKTDLIIGIGSPFFGGLIGLLGLRAKCPSWFYVDHLRYLKEGFLEELKLIKESRPDFLGKALKTADAVKSNFINVCKSEYLLLFSLSKCRLIFASNYLKDRVVKRLWSTKALKSPVAYPIFSQDFDTNISQKTKEKQKLIFYFGGLHYKRGVIDLLKVFAELSNNFGDLKLLIAGYPVQPETDHYLKTILRKDKKLNKKVKAVGEVSQKKLSFYIKSSFIIAFPFHSPFSVQPPLALIEAMAQAKPIIATKVGAIPEIVVDKKNGLLFTAKDQVGFKNKMEWALKNEGKTKAMGEKAQKTARKLLKQGLIDLVLGDLKNQTKGWDSKKYYSKLDPLDYEKDRFKGGPGKWIGSLEQMAFLNLDKNSSNSGSIVVDVATGTGRITEVLVQNETNKKIYGIDINENMLSLAKKKFKNNKKIELFKGDAYKLPFSNKQIDKVVGGRILMHLSDKSGFFREAARILKPRGVLILDYLNKNSLLFLLRLSPLRKRVWGLDFKEKFCSKKEIKQLALMTGYKVKEYQSVLFFGETIYRKWPFLVNFLGPIDNFLCQTPFFKNFSTKIVVALEKDQS